MAAAQKLLAAEPVIKAQYTDAIDLGKPKGALSIHPSIVIIRFIQHSLITSFQPSSAQSTTGCAVCDACAGQSGPAKEGGCC